MKRAIAAAALAASPLLVLAGCATSVPAEQPTASPQHIHTIAATPGSDDILLATHEGIWIVDDTGSLTGPLGDFDFDGMGFTITDDAWFASGHPGATTPAELGSPNLGIIRSDDQGQSWEPVAFTGQEDFHVLEAATDGTLYGIGSSSTAVRRSTDEGRTWSVGAEIEAVSLAATSDGRLFAATPSGVLVSQNSGVSFDPVPDAPTLYLLDAVGDVLVGAGIDGNLWRMTDAGQWEQLAATDGAATAIAATDSGALMVDDRGVVRLDGEQTIIVLPAG